MMGHEDEGYDETIVQGAEVMIGRGDKVAAVGGELYYLVGDQWVLSTREAPSRFDHRADVENETGRDE